MQKRSQGHTSTRIARFPQCHRAHSHTRNSTSARMRYLRCIWRNRRSREDEMSKPGPVVDLKTNCIPKARKLLPLVNKPRRITLQQSLYVDLCQLKVFLLRIGISHVKDTFCNLLTCCGLATPFRSFYQNCTCAFKPVRKEIIGNSFAIFFCHLVSIISNNTPWRNSGSVVWRNSIR